jgi:predicted acylesterase/phospholipase RssA
MGDVDYRRFADYGFGGKWIGGVRNALTRRGLARGEEFKEWLRGCLSESPLGKPDPTFADLERDDIPADAPPEQREAARYRLRVIASDVSAGRMLVLPQDIEGYEDEEGPLTAATLKVVEAVRMSMSFPFFFDPVTLRRGDRPHLIVDGGLLSNFPVWLFDGPTAPRRPTYGFRLHPGHGAEQPYYAGVPTPLWELPLAKALLHAATDAWDERLEHATRVRTVSIPTFEVSTLDFGLSAGDAERLYRSGLEAASDFFGSETRYVNQFGRTAPGPAQLRR